MEGKFGRSGGVRSGFGWSGEQVVGSGGQVWAVGRLLVGLVGPVNLAGIFSCFVLHSWYDRAGGSASSVFSLLIIAVKFIKAI